LGKNDCSIGNVCELAINYGLGQHIASFGSDVSKYVVEYLGIIG
jgi:hypothetical protein